MSLEFCHHFETLMSVKTLCVFKCFDHYSKGSNDDFSAYDFENKPSTIAISTFLGHADHDWDQRLQDRMI